ncbi:MAG: HAD family hydrolase [Alphaproteobacteria bacterium]
MKNLKVAVFDLDGTLISSDSIIYTLLNESLNELGKKSVKINIIQQLISLPLGKIIQTILPNESLDFYEECQNLFHHKYQEATAKNHHIICYPYVEEQLKKLNDAGWIMAICTGAERKSCENNLEENRIRKYFVSLKTASDGFPPKPDPEILRTAIAECGGNLKHAIMIGDTSYDIGMAHKINVKSIGVSWGYHKKEQLIAAGANEIIDSPEQLFESLERLIHE